MSDPCTPVSAGSTASCVELNVGGVHYTTSLATLRSVRDSMLEIMFREDQIPTTRDKYDRIFIDRDGTHFGVILNYLRDLQIPFGVSSDVRRALQAEARFYNIADLLDWAMKVDEELREAEATTAGIAGACADRITTSLGMYLETLCVLLQQINLVDWAQQARSLSKDALLHLGASIKDLAVRFLCILPQFLFVFGSVPLFLVVILRTGYESDASVPMHINVGGQLVTASRFTLSGNRHAARLLQIPFNEGEEDYIDDDFIFTGRLYCYANDLYAPRWQFLVSRRCNFLVRNFTGERIEQQIVSLRTGGRLMGPGEFHAISRCWCAVMQSVPDRDREGNVFLDRDPALMNEILRALRYPEETNRALRSPERARDSGFLAFSREVFCKEIEYFGIVDFLASCSEATDVAFATAGQKSASALLAFNMLQLSMKDLNRHTIRDFTDIDIPLEQVVHNRHVVFQMGLHKQLDNPITESKKRLQANLESLFKNEFICCFFLVVAAIVFWAYTTCKPLLPALTYLYLRLVLSPALGFLMLGMLLFKEYHFSDWGPEDFVAWFCPMPQKCHKLDHLLDYQSKYDNQNRHLQQSHVCDRALDLAWNSLYVYQYMQVPLLLLSSGSICCYACGLTGALVENGMNGLVVHPFRGIVASWIVWAIRWIAFVIPCLTAVLGFSGIDGPITSRDERHIQVFHPSYTLDDFWELVTNYLHRLAEFLSECVVNFIYNNKL